MASTAPYPGFSGLDLALADLVEEVIKVVVAGVGAVDIEVQALHV